MTERGLNLEKAWAEGESKVGAVTMRPFSFGTLSFARLMGLTILTGPLDKPAPKEGEAPVEDEPLKGAEMQEQLAAFCWLQSAPLEEVKRAVRGGVWKREVEEFSFTLDLAMLPEIMNEITRISAMSAAAAVDVVSKPGAKEEGAPPNS